jgi:hypothetical protein
MEKISWTDRVRNEEVLLRVKEWRIWIVADFTVYSGKWTNRVNTLCGRNVIFQAVGTITVVHAGIWYENGIESDYLEDPGVDGREVLKWTVNE